MRHHSAVVGVRSVVINSRLAAPVLSTMLSSHQSPMIHAELKAPLDFEQSERLLAFCLECGVSCFSATLLYWDEQQLRRANAVFFDRLAPFSLGRRRLERTVVPDGGDRLIPMKCWALNPRRSG